MGEGPLRVPFLSLGTGSGTWEETAHVCTRARVCFCRCLARAQCMRLDDEAPSSLPVTGQVCTGECVPVLQLISHVTSLGLNAFVYKKGRTLFLPASLVYSEDHRKECTERALSSHL